MIPPIAPTYTYRDLIKSLKLSARGQIEEELRQRLMTMFKSNHVIFIGYARTALYLLLKAYNNPGGVLMPSFTCLVVPEAVQYAGYYPVFADVAYPSMNISPETLRRSISPEITVVLAIHSFGLPCNVNEMREITQEHDILLVEDVAPSFGAELRNQRVGTFGDASIISFNHGKVISGEDGGALITNNDDLAYKVIELIRKNSATENRFRSFFKAFTRKIYSDHWMHSAKTLFQGLHKSEKFYQVVFHRKEIPTNYIKPCSPISSALVLIQLERLNWNLSRRKKIGQIYQEELSGLSSLSLPEVAEDCSPAWVQYSLLIEKKEAFYKYMQQNGVGLSLNFSYSCADSYNKTGYPNGQQVAKEILGLPTYPFLTDDQVYHICNLAKQFPA